MSKLKIPPHNLDAEKSVLWSIFIDKESLYQVSDLLKWEDFYDNKNALIWNTIIDLNNSHTPIDLLTISDKLERWKKLELAWWIEYLADLSSEVPTASHIVTYWWLVKDASTRRKMIKVWSEIMWYWYEEEKELIQLLEKTEKWVFSISQTFIKNKFIHIRDVLAWRFEFFSERHDSDWEEDENSPNVMSWFKHLDEKMNGFKPSDLIILAARPSMWKTALALNIAQNAAMIYWKSVWIFSLEMSKEQLVDRLFCSTIWVDSWKLHKWLLSDEDFAKLWTWMDKLGSANIFIDDNVWASIAEVKAKARRLKMEHWLDMIMIDYLQLMTSWNPALAANRVQEISEISRSLKELARDLSIPIIALSQLSRAVEQRPWKIPALSDLRDSWSIEQDADAVFMLFREDYYEPDTDRKWFADLFIRKNRNWPVWRIELQFKKEQMKFVDVERNISEDMFAWIE